jgi:hypothetical protein
VIGTHRDTVSLDGTWEFIPDRVRQFGPKNLPAGEPITVPGPWEAQLARPYGIVRAWYRRRFAVPNDWRSGILVIQFGSAMARATVWLDGQLVGQCDDGYLPFEAEAGAPRHGSERDLVVAVENPVNALTEYPAFGDNPLWAATERLDAGPIDGLPVGKQTWYTSTSGLLGSVSAELAPDPRLAALMVLPDLDAGQAHVRWRLAGQRARDPGALTLTVISPAGQRVAEVVVDARAGRATIDVPDPKPWDLWRPTLYGLNARLGNEGHGASPGEFPTDDASIRFGMRSVAVREGAILLNERPIYIRGALDQDFWPAGRSNAPSRGAIEEQLDLAREMGLNLLRCHVKIPSPTYLDVADAAGMLLWCELPNWTRFDHSAPRTGRRMLTRMVETMGSHPSIIAWTIINEDWATDLRHEARDRRWLRATADWLKTIDPSRLVVDNSACDTPAGPNFHLRTDIADFHAYRSMPDGLPWWRDLIADFARRPGWLWSPHGDAAPTGQEALVLSEFGGWGLPRPSAVGWANTHQPWWWTTGRTFRRPEGIHRRFAQQRLDRIWPDVNGLADATQWRQFEALVAQVRELRRYPSIRGYVITELADAFWEANGLLDVARGHKAFHDRLAEINAPHVLLVDMPRSDLWGGEALVCDVTLSSFPDAAGSGLDGHGRLEWRIRMEDGASRHGSASIGDTFRDDARMVARLELDVPDVVAVTRAELSVTASSGRGGAGAIYRQALVIVPSAMRGSERPRRIRVHDPHGEWSIAARLAALGHELVATSGADLVVSSRIDARLLDNVDHGASLLLLARSTSAVPTGLGGPCVVRPRRPENGTSPGERPWDGDWSSVFAWALPGVVPGLPEGGLLGDAHGEIFPDHVLDGLDVASASDGVEVGLFSGWVHTPASLLASVDRKPGRLVVTTLRLAPEDGPMATAMLESLVQRTVAA